MDKTNRKHCWKMESGRYGIIVILTIILSTDITNAASNSRQNRTMISFCPEDFVRLGGSCYHFSATRAIWDEAYFLCKDKKSNLTVPERWEDRNIREYLNKHDIERGDRWIGGLYDWEAKSWKWGGALRTMKYQSFSRMPRLPPEQLKWNCVAMIPDLLYRWSPRGCVEKKYFICQTKLRKVYINQNSVSSDVDGNDIPLPEADVDNEVNPNMSPNFNYMNERNSFNNQLSNNNYPIRRNIGRAEFARRNKTGNNQMKRKKKPFPGYKRIKDDPEATYLHNVKALKSGKNGLTQAQIAKHLNRLERLRKKEEREKRRNEISRNERNKQRNRINNNEEQESLLSSDRSNIRSRHIIDNDWEPRKHYKNIEFKGFENVTQRTYMMNNQLSVLHPNTIVEIHEFSNKNK